VEDAFEDMVDLYAGTHLDGVAISKGLAAATAKTVPRVAIMCPAATTEKTGNNDNIINGWWWVDVEVSIVTNYKEEDRDSRSNRAGELFDIFFEDNLPARLNNMDGVSGIYFSGDDPDVHSAGWLPETVTRGVSGDHSFLETLTGRIRCAPLGASELT
jgi:hypothetical protein